MNAESGPEGRGGPPPDDAAGPRGPHEPDQPGPPGLQPERTQLAWRRTALSCAVVALLAGRQVLQGPQAPLRYVAAALIALAFAAFLGLVRERGHELAAPRPPRLSLRMGAAAAACAVAIAAFGAALLA